MRHDSCEETRVQPIVVVTAEPITRAVAVDTDSVMPAMVSFVIEL
jgi:hypothetical protein